MARHSLFPNSITINYTSNGHAHKQVLPIGAISGSSPDWLVPVRTGSPIPWEDAVDQYALLFAGLFDGDSSIDSADLYDYEATDAPASYLTSHPIGIAGTNIATGVAWEQIVFPFKAIGGTRLRLTGIETVVPPDQKETFAGISVAYICDLLEYILGDDDFIITRGGDFPSVSLGYTSKINDKLRRRYLAAS